MAWNWPDPVLEFSSVQVGAGDDPGTHRPSGLGDVVAELPWADRDQVMALMAERLTVAVGREAG